MIEIPKAFKEFCAWYDLEYRDELSDGQDLIAFVLDNIGVDGRSVVKSFLSTLLSGEFSNDALQDLWRRAGARVLFTSETDLRPFFEHIVDRISAGRF